MTGFDRKKLAEYDGQSGQKAYVAYQGKIYDLTDSKRWKNGKHMMRHQAGKSLTVEMNAAPHGPEVLENFAQVGMLIDDADKKDTNIPWPLSWIYETFPIVKRHAHPVAVHFPIAFFLGSLLFCLLYLFYGNESFADTSFYLVLLGTATAPFSMITGFQSWWLYYGLKPTKGILFKIFGGLTLIILGAIASTLYYLNPDLLTGDSPSITYIVILVIGGPLVMAIGAIGGQMTFPD